MSFRRLRAYHPKYGMCPVLVARWFEGYEPGDDWQIDTSDGPITVQPGDIEVMDSTGLYDKNGTEIFEGDILDVTAGYYGPIIAVEWNQPTAQFIGVSAKGRTFHDHEITRRFIIGSIHENPELLGGGK